MARRATLCGLGYTVVRAKLHGGGRVCHPSEDRSRPMLAECLMGNTLPGPDLDSGIVKEDGPVKPMTGICPTQPRLTQCCCLTKWAWSHSRVSQYAREAQDKPPSAGLSTSFSVSAKKLVTDHEVLHALHTSPSRHLPLGPEFEYQVRLNQRPGKI